jgi:hypothetical protein
VCQITSSVLIVKQNRLASATMVAKRSTYPFCQGKRNDVGRSRIPIARRRALNATPNEIAHRSNDYDKAFQVSMKARPIPSTASSARSTRWLCCENCGIRIVGHGLEKDGTFFCCDHCAEVRGVTGLRDGVGAEAPCWRARASGATPPMISALSRAYRTIP